MTDWLALTRRAGFASHRLIGWIYWDPVAQQNLERLGVPGGLGHYVSYRAAPLAAAGTESVVAAFYTIKSELLELALNHAAPHATWHEIHRARDEALLTGITQLAPEIKEPLGTLAKELWAVVDAAPVGGRVLFAAHKQWPRPENQFLSSWHAINALREWRGDTHFALLVTEEIGAVEAGLLHDAWMGYPDKWIPKSRGATEDEIQKALSNLATRGLADSSAVNSEGIRYRQWLEDKTDQMCLPIWQGAGEKLVNAFLDIVEPVSDRFLQHIDSTAGDYWMPAARSRRI